MARADVMVSARWEHGRIVRNIARHLETHFEAKGSSCQTFTETFYMKSRALETALDLPALDVDPLRDVYRRVVSG